MNRTHAVGGVRLAGWGRAAVLLFGVHVVLLFFPPIPPLVKGSLWSYLAGYGAVVLGLEEIDYFGIFGGLIGRVEGVYVGSLHDVVHLAAKRLLSALAWIAIGALAIAIHAVLFRSGYVQPRAIASMLASVDVLWAVAGLGLLGYAALVEIPPFGLRGAGHTPEEAVELAGAAGLVLFGLQRWAATARGTA